MFDIPNSSSHLEPRNYDRIRRMMLDPEYSPYLATFTDVMQGLSREEPEVIALTANSAIPASDAIREYYTQLDLPQPSLVPIKVNRRTSRDYENGKTRKASREAKRIARYVVGRRVAIIDQFIDTRKTMEVGEEMLENAGAAHVITHPDVKWYSQANPEDIDNENLTSIHEDFMRGIGKAAAAHVKKYHRSFT